MKALTRTEPDRAYLPTLQCSAVLFESQHDGRLSAVQTNQSRSTSLQDSQRKLMSTCACGSLSCTRMLFQRPAHRKRIFTATVHFISSDKIPHQDILVIRQGTSSRSSALFLILSVLSPTRIVCNRHCAISVAKAVGWKPEVLWAQSAILLADCITLRALIVNSGYRWDNVMSGCSVRSPGKYARPILGRLFSLMRPREYKTSSPQK